MPPFLPAWSGGHSLPDGASLLVLGLIGTTVVPYNLFLGSGIARGQKLGDMRFGLSIAVVLGGLISMGGLVVGTAVDGPFVFAALADALALGAEVMLRAAGARAAPPPAAGPADPTAGATPPPESQAAAAETPIEKATTATTASKAKAEEKSKPTSESTTKKDKGKVPQRDKVRLAMLTLKDTLIARRSTARLHG